MFSRIKDVDSIILSKLDDNDLFNLCQVSRTARELCSYEPFWRNRFIDTYSPTRFNQKPDNMSWKHYYLKTVVDTEQLSQGMSEISNKTFSKDALYILTILIDNYLKKIDPYISSLKLLRENVKNMISDESLKREVDNGGMNELRKYNNYGIITHLIEIIENKYHFNREFSVYLSGVLDFLLYEVIRSIDKQHITGKDLLETVQNNEDFKLLFDLK